jgi:tetratricopeptide (TPR) repeat protein
MLTAFQKWLGPGRFRTLIGLLIGTGLASTGLQIAFPEADWLAGAQVVLVLCFLGGGALIIGAAMSPVRQRRWAFMVGPALLALVVGLLLIPGWSRFFMGAALGWLLVSQLMLRDLEGREYKLAVKAIRKNNYGEALSQMTQLIEREPDKAEHYEFRAQILRLDKQLGAAKADYERAMALDAKSAVGANGLAEIYLEENNLSQARHWADVAYKQAPEEWVAAYNLGLIAERQGDDKTATTALKKALGLKMPDSRHRLLCQFWLLKVYHRQGKKKDLSAKLEALRKEHKGLHEWEVILESDESAGLRRVFQQDVRMIKDLLDGKQAEDVLSAAG